MIAAPHENYKVLAKAPTRRVYVRATISGSSSQTVTSDDKIISFTIDKGAQSGGMSIGNAYCAKLTMKLIDTQVSPGDVVQVMNSFRFPEGSVVASNFLGFFYVQTVSRKGRTTTLTAYDNIIKMSKDYKSKLTYPATIEAVLNEVCGSGMTVDSNIAIPQYIVTENPIKGINSEGKTLFYTKRQMLGFIASLLGGNFYLGSGNNILYLTKYSAAAESMEAANTISADFSGYSFSVTDVVYSEDGISISRDDEKDSAGVLEFECPLKLVTAPSAIAETIKAALSSFQYEGATLTRQGYGLYELGELVTAYDSEGTAHTILISGINQKFENGSFVEKYYSCAESSEEQNYNSGDITGQTVPQSISDHGTVNSPLTEYKYLTDLSVKFNGTTYTAEKDGATGLISRISDDAGNEFEPTISSGITDVALHNAVFWAVAMCRGLPNPPNIVELYNAGNEYAGITGGWSFATANRSWETLSGVSYEKRSGSAYGELAKITTGERCLMFRTNNKVNVSNYTSLRAEGRFYANYDDSSGIKARLMFGYGTSINSDNTTALTRSQNFSRTDGILTQLMIDIPSNYANQELYINFTLWDGASYTAETAYFEVTRIWLE